MNVYDFDKTIYEGDCTLDFWRYSVRRYPRTLRAFPLALYAGGAYRCGFYSKERFKETFYRFLQYVPDVGDAVRYFWDVHASKMSAWYLKQMRADDLIISASPEFLISELCARLEVRYIASKVDPLTGKLGSPNCAGVEKVNRLIAEYPDAEIEQFYSDSESDAPLAHLAAQAYLVKGGSIMNWSPANKIPTPWDEHQGQCKSE